MMHNHEFKHVLGFAVLACAITWTIWLTGILLIDGLNKLDDERFFVYLLTGSFGPGVAALIISGLIFGISAKIAYWKIATTMIGLAPVNALLGGILSQRSLLA